MGVLTLVDRQEMNGRENIEKQIPNFKALVTRDEVMRMYRGLRSLRLAGDARGSLLILVFLLRPALYINSIMVIL